MGRYHFPERYEHTTSDEKRNDSPWSTIAGERKSFDLTPNYVIDKMTLQNCIMYSSTLPDYEDGGNKNREYNADDPRNAHILDDLINRQN